MSIATSHYNQQPVKRIMQFEQEKSLDQINDTLRHGNAGTGL